MRQFFLCSIATLAGIVAGIGGTWFFRGGTTHAGIPDQASMLNVRPPRYVEDGIDRNLGVDGVWEREIKNHAFRLETEVLQVAMEDPDVEKTSWYGSFADRDRRLSALEAGLHVEHIPETSFLLIWFDGSPESDTAIIGNTVVRAYCDMVKRDVRMDKIEEMSELSLSMQRRLRQAEDITLQLERIHDQSRVEELQLERKSLREQRLELGVKLEQVRRRLEVGDYSPIELIRIGLTPRDY